MKKIFYVVLDGMGDLPIPELDFRTPLEAAETPNMDSLARHGRLGLMYPIAKGVAPESDAAVLSILGYDVDLVYTGRGPLEAFGSGVEVNDGDLAWRCNFATVAEDGRTIVDRRVGRNLSDPEAAELAAAVNRDVKLDGADFIFKHTIGHRAILVIRPKEGRLSAMVNNPDPGYLRHGVYSVAVANPGKELLDCEPIDDSPESARSAKLTNEFLAKSHEVLKNHPVNKKRESEGKMPGNMIALRDAGDRLPTLVPIEQGYGVKFGTLVEMPVERGIARLAKMEEVELPDVTGNAEQDYLIRAQKTLEAIQNFDGLYIHLKGPDVFGHDGDYMGKMRSIADIDKYYFGNLLPNLFPGTYVIAITADHSTPCALKSHSDDPVPLLIEGANVDWDGSQFFGESACREGKIGTIIGQELMPRLVELAKREDKR
jgi:2,3-bisphosphoglycerate-independent phosphoglycerate mutase